MARSDQASVTEFMGTFNYESIEASWEKKKLVGFVKVIPDVQFAGRFYHLNGF